MSSIRFQRDGCPFQQGSGFDSTQYAELIDCTDNYLIKLVFDDVIHEMRRSGLDISTPLARNLRKNLTSLKTPYIIRC